MCKYFVFVFLQDEIRYGMIQNQLGTPITNFYLGPFSGLISLRELLVDTGINTYQVNKAVIKGIVIT